MQELEIIMYLFNSRGMSTIPFSIWRFEDIFIENLIERYKAVALILLLDLYSQHPIEILLKMKLSTTKLKKKIL